MESTNQKHYLAAITAFFIWGFFSLPLKYLSSFSAGEILYFRVLIAVFILCFIFIFIRRDIVQKDLRTLLQLEKKQKIKLIILTVLGGLLLVLNWLSYIYVVNEVNIKTASFSYLICPVLTAVFSYIIIKENLRPLQWVSVSLCALSCVLIGKDSMRELGYSLLVASTYALYLVSQRKNIHFDKLMILAVQLLSSIIIITPFYRYLVYSTPVDINFYIVVFIISLLFTVIPLYLNLFALKNLKSATIGILMYLNPIINFILGVFYFGETVSTIQMAGYLIIGIAIIIFNYENIRKINPGVRPVQG